MWNWKSVFNPDGHPFVTVYNDGTTKNLMSITGTIPVVYTGKKELPPASVIRILEWSELA